jgi:hypothetical protein
MNWSERWLYISPRKRVSLLVVLIRPRKWPFIVELAEVSSQRVFYPHLARIVDDGLPPHSYVTLCSIVTVPINS